MPEADAAAAGGARRGLTQAQFQREYLYSPSPPQGAADRLRDHLRRSCSGASVRRRLPLLRWLPGYSCRRHLVVDLAAAAAVATTHLPQGMAFAHLAGIPPVHGLYMAALQCVLYAALGTSPHLSVGPSAVLCLMTGQAVASHAAWLAQPPGRQTPGAVQLVSTITMAVGLMQLALFCLRLSAVRAVLSDMLVQGLTTAAAVHVITSQLETLLGLSLPPAIGFGKEIKVCIEVMRNIADANPESMTASVIAVSILILNNEVLKPIVARWTRLPVPAELVVVVLGAGLSSVADLPVNFRVQVIGNVPTSLLRPGRPDLRLLPPVLWDAVAIAILGYALSVSEADDLARRHGHHVDDRQELLAHGVSNVVSAWFGCAPMGTSRQRSLLLAKAGGKTQASGLFTSLLLLTVLLWLVPVFQFLPKCVLSSVAVVSSAELLTQAADVPRLWRASGADTLVWLTTAAVAVCWDPAAGLAVGLLVSVAVLLWRCQHPPADLLGHLCGTELYRDQRSYAAAGPVPNVRVVRFGGALHCCNVRYFRARLAALAGPEPVRRRDRTSSSKRLHQRAGRVGTEQELQTLLKSEDPDAGKISPSEASGVSTSDVFDFSFLVLDMSQVSFTDTASTRDLIDVIREYSRRGVSCCLAGCKETVLRMLHACDSCLAEDLLYPSVHDAVLAVGSGRPDGGGRHRWAGPGQLPRLVSRTDSAAASPADRSSAS